MLKRFLSLLLSAILFLPVVLAAAARGRFTRKSSGVSAARRSRLSKSPRRPSSYVDPTLGDNVDGEDLPVRRAAVEALGYYNGSVVVVDPNTGRALTIVNQKLALQSGFQPCSTIKLVTAFAALSERIVERDTPLRLGKRLKLDLISALAHSNNPYFASLGTKLGFERVRYYARLFGLGEKAGLDIEGEQPGVLPDAPPRNGGVGMMTSFGEGILLTPLELASLLSAISNGGTLYYVQHPSTQEEVDHFVPRVKRRLEIQPWIPDVKMGMRAVVDFGTGHRANYDANEPIMGKTGTCTDYHALTHLGWFGSFNDVERNKLAVVVLLTGGKAVNGPVAAGVAGAVYKNLSAQNYFARATRNLPEVLITTPSCCAR